MASKDYDFTVVADPLTGLFDSKRLAAFLKIKPSSIRTLRRRGQLPPPLSSNINGGPVWDQKIVNNYYLKRKDITVNTPEPNPNLPKVIDLFAGCGGLSLGFQYATFDVLAGFDNWKPAINTYNENLDHPCFDLDLGDIESTIEAIAPFMDGETGIIGGPPCQDFSSAGLRTEGDKADLTEKFARVVTHFMPPFFVMENVERARISAAYTRALSHLKDCGYDVSYQILDASRCGVPQKRKRLITFGSTDAAVAKRYNAWTESHLAAEPMTIREYFVDPLDTDFYYRHPRSYARRGIFSIDEPSPTIRGVNRPIPSNYKKHPGDAAPVSLARPLTTHERAQIQTFPVDYNFIGAKTVSEQMIGNAVPVNLGKYVGNAVAEAYLLSPTPQPFSARLKVKKD